MSKIIRRNGQFGNQIHGTNKPSGTATIVRRVTDLEGSLEDAKAIIAKQLSKYRVKVDAGYSLDENEVKEILKLIKL